MELELERHFGESGLVRVDTFKRPDGSRSYKFSVPYFVENDLAIVKGLFYVGITKKEYIEIIRKINTDAKKLVAYYREGPPEIFMVQMDPAVTNGKIVFMRKERIAHPNEAAGNPTKHAEIAEHALKQIAAGHYKVKIKSIGSVSQNDLPDGGVEIRMNSVVFERHETNKDEKAHDPE